MPTTEQLAAALVGRYAVDRLIGEGGMATVYLARDVRHDRPVALKVLNPELGAVLGVERFLAEIRVTANLQHPNLLPLFDSGEAGGLLFYVMPYVEGESLRARLQREKQLPIDDAIRIAVAVADALDYAHGNGVIHRDLKPENILLQHGQPVIADFGIALAVSKAGGNRITQTGLSLGTPQYMSPEQATGDRVIDGRSDIYSLAAVTYEMLSGEPPHIGNTSQAIIARVLTDRPRPIRATRQAVPEHVEYALSRALEKLPADRFSTAREFADALTGKATATSATMAARAHPVAPMWRSRLRDPLVLGLGIVAVAATAALIVSRRGRNETVVAPIRFAVSTPDSAPANDNFPWPAAISPDGRFVVYSAAPSAGARPQLWLLRTDQIHGHPIPGTESAGQPSFSPSGAWLLFEANNKEWKVRLDGSTPVAVADGASYNGVDWTSKDEIINGATGNFHGLSIYSASGGERAVLTHPDSAHGELEHIWPISFPSGKTVAFTIWRGALATAQLGLARIPYGTVTPLGLKGVRPLAMLEGMLVYVQADGAVMAVAVDEGAGRATGKPIPVHDRIDVIPGNNGNSRAFISQGGALVVGHGNVLSRLAWQDRSNTIHVITKQRAAYFNPRLSPDGTHIAVVVIDGDQSDVWIQDLATGTLSRLTTVGSVSSVEWADNSHVAFAASGDSSRNGVWLQQATGAAPARLLFETSELSPTASIARDGRSMVVQMLRGNSWDLARVALDTTPRKAQLFLATGANEVNPHISPNGKWVLYLSDETGRFEVYVRSYPNPATKVQVSSGAGGTALWSPDGSSIYYQAGTRIVEARVVTTPAFRVISHDSVFTAPATPGLLAFTSAFEPTRDRNRLLVIGVESNSYQLIAVPNWLTEFRARTAATRK